MGGLLPVDIILRRPNSEDCDPLELQPHSSLGVAGLLQAVREGQVAVVNALGSGLVESPVLMAFLPQLSVALLGEPLRLPGIATWWCGEEDSRSYVLEHLDELIVKPAYRQRGREFEISRQLSQLSTGKLRERIAADPAAYVAQEKVVRSTAPVWTGESTAHGSQIAIRAFLVRSADGYLGHARRTDANLVLDRLPGAIGPGRRAQQGYLDPGRPARSIRSRCCNRPGAGIELRRSGAELPSRVADNLFWLGRHLERADAAARLLRTISTRLTGEPDAEGAAELPVLLHCLAEQGQIEPGFVVEGIRDQLPAIEQALPDATLDEGQPGSLRSIVTRMFRVASLVRDRMSIDSWRIMKRIDQQLDAPRFRQANMTDVVSMTNNVIVDLAAFSGLAMESMTRTLGWRFLDLGRRLERALQTTSLMQSCFRDVVDSLGPVLEAVLEVADSLMTYRSRYLANLQLAAVLDLLLTDEINPRSVAYQLVSIANHIQNLPREQTQPVYAAEQRYAMSLLHTVRMTDVLVLAELHMLGEHEHLQNILSRLADELPKLAEAISHRYLIHAGLPRQLSEIRPELHGAMKYKVTHITRYTYSEAVPVCHNEVRLTPRQGPGQTCEDCRLLINPTPSGSGSRLDYYGNVVNFFSIQEAHDTLTVTASSRVTVAPPPVHGRNTLGELGSRDPGPATRSLDSRTASLPVRRSIPCTSAAAPHWPSTRAARFSPSDRSWRPLWS